MANTVNTKIVVGGPRNVVLAVYLKSDGASGDLVDEVLITPAEAGLQPGERFHIQYLAYNFAGFDAVVSFDTGLIVPNFKWVLSAGTNAPQDFRPFSNLRDDSGMDGTGDLLLSTTGFTAATDQGSMLILLRAP